MPPVSVIRRAPLHIQAAAIVFRNDAAFDEPALIRAAMAGNDDDGHGIGMGASQVLDFWVSDSIDASG
jgi:hypothetical protein